MNSSQPHKLSSPQAIHFVSKDLLYSATDVVLLKSTGSACEEHWKCTERMTQSLLNRGSLGIRDDPRISFARRMQQHSHSFSESVHELPLLLSYTHSRRYRS